MSSPAAFGSWPGHPAHAVQTPPPMPVDSGPNEDGITIKPMRLKVLYTFDDQNKTNCLARWPHVLQIQTVMVDDGATIGVIELKTCIQAIVQCSPELVARLGQDYTVYAYDYSEYDNPLVGQGMLSRVLQTTSPAPEAPAQQSGQLITGRVCKNILGLFANGVKETLEVKLRLVPVPTSLQNEYQNTMDKYREMNRSVPPPGFDVTEWNSLIQSAPNFGTGQMQNQGSFQREGMSMEVVNQLLSPCIPEPQMMESFSAETMSAPSPLSMAPTPRMQHEDSQDLSTMVSKQSNSRPSSRSSVKRPLKGNESSQTVGGNNSGYEEATDGDDLPAPKKRVKTIKATDWNQKSAFGRGGDLRVAASTAGSLRLFRPIAVSPAITAGNHLQEVPRAPTPVPKIPQGRGANQSTGHNGVRRDSFLKESSFPNLSFGEQSGVDDELRYSIESAGPSPERQDTPADTPPEFGSSPPVMRTRPPSPMRSSPPCPTSPCLPPMPRTDSGFMSGTIDELFGDDDVACLIEDEDNASIIAAPAKRKRGRAAGRQSSVARTKTPAPEPGSFHIEEPGPVELLPTRMPVHAPHKQPKPPKEKTKRSFARTNSRASSVMSEDGSQSLPALPPSLPPMVPGMPQLLPRPPMSKLQISQSQSTNQPLRPAPQQQAAAGEANSQNNFTQQLPKPSKNSKPRARTPAQKPSPHAMPQPASDIPINIQEPEVMHHFNTGPSVEHNSQQTTNQQNHRESEVVSASGSRDMASNTPPLIPQDVTEAAKQMAPQPVSSNLHSVPHPLQGQRRPSVPASSVSAPENRRAMVRTASLGSLSLPQVPASDPVLPPSSLSRSHTWSEAPHPMTEGPVPPASDIEVPTLDDSLSQPTGNGVPYNRTWNAKKAAIRHKLETAILNGEMPPYCCNCGAIETPTWRKAWSQECQGAPGYYEYSDEPGKVTAIVILTRDTEGNPTSYQLIKKYLRAEESVADFKEFILCNPCGIWMSKYKTQRPPERWENSMIPLEKKVIPPRRPQYQRTSRTKKPGTKNSEPPVSFNNEQTQVGYGPSPTDTSDVQSQTVPPQEQRERSASIQPSKKASAMTSDAASAALRRAIQSSPARWDGSRHSPIDLDVEEVDTTRRLLFPSPRKDGSPKILGELTTNVVQISPGYVKDQVLNAPNKENCPPMTATEGEDEALLKLFEEELARPTTPVQKCPQISPFKTPTRPTPNHRPITRSVSKSARKSPGHFLGLTPSRVTPRRSPRNHDGGFVSPFTATLNQMMSEANSQTHSPSRNLLDGVELDFDNLPDLPLGSHGNLDNSFSLEDFFSTDVPMPSSPPRAFRLYEDPVGGLNMNNIDWNEFQNYGKGLSAGASANDEVAVKKEPEPSPQKKATPKKKGGK